MIEELYMEHCTDLRTQIVYVLVSTSDDIYLEQLWGSVYSIRQFHPKTRIVVLLDAPTKRRFEVDEKLKPLCSMISELKEVEVPEDYSCVLRSRDIKTRVRNLIDGDFLFVDTDTIIAGPIDGIDRLDIKNMAMVADLHRQQATDNECGLIWLKMLFGMDVTDSNATYFNSGVAYVRDNPLTREFYAKWHENWLNTGFYIDQPALFYTNSTFGGVIEKLPDIYNCMGVFSAYFWSQARIIHYLGNNNLPFRMLKAIPKQIQEVQGFNGNVKDLLLNPKNHLSVHTCFCSYYDWVFLNGYVFQFCMRTKWIHWCITKVNKWVSKKHLKKAKSWK